MDYFFKYTTIWSGNTLSIESGIKALGGRWDSDRQAWTVPPMGRRDREKAAQLCKRATATVDVKIME